MSNQLPIFIDEQKIKLDWEAHRKEPLEDRLNALRPYLKGFVDQKFNELRIKFNHKNKSLRIGAIGELEFLEKMVFEEKKIVEVLEDQREKFHSRNPNRKVTKPDYLIDGEIIEVKSKDGKEAGKRVYKEALDDSNKQIKWSDYDTPTQTKYEYPQGKLAIWIVGKELNLSLDEISEFIKEQCSPSVRKSLKEVAVYYENELVRKLQRDKNNRMVEVPINQVYIDELGKESDIVTMKLNLSNPEQLKNLTCKFSVLQVDGQNYIAVHKDDLKNESLKQLLGIDREEPRIKASSAR